MKIGDKIQIPINCYNYSGGLKARDTAAVCAAEEFNQKFLYIRDITDKKVYVSAEKNSTRMDWSSFHINDVELYNPYIEIY